MSVSLPIELRAVLSSGKISAADVLSMRRSFYGDAKISATEADWLFALNDGCKNADPAWDIFFVEALTDYAVFQMKPEGYIDDATANWLISKIDTDGTVKTTSELELLINVLEKSQSSPGQLVKYALEQVKHAIIFGSGPARNGLTLEPGAVGAADVAMLRRVLYAYGGDRNVSITQDEAEVLFDINDATVSAKNDAAWVDLFAKAIANHIMMASGYQAPSREDALHLGKWVDDTSTDVGSFFTRMVGGLKDVVDLYKRDNDTLDQGQLKQGIAIAESERVTESEAQWLVERMNRDGNLSEAERAVLSFIKREATDVHPSLLPLLDRVA